MKLLFLCFIIIVTISNANANNSSIEAYEVEHQKIQVLNTVKKYAEVTACNTTFDKYETTIKQVFLISKVSSETEFLVLWGGTMVAIYLQLGEGNIEFQK